MEGNKEDTHVMVQEQFIYRRLFDKYQIVMMLINPATGEITEANQAASLYYGYTKDQLLTMRIQDINILSSEEIEEEMLRAEAEKRNYFQFIHRLANNERREVEVYSFPIETVKGKLLFSTIHDISDKIRQKLMFDTVFFDSPYGVAILDKDQRIVNINKNFTYLFGYSLEEVTGKSIKQLLSPSNSHTQIDENIKLVYRGEVVKQEGIRRSQDGKLIDVEILGYPMINHQEVIGVYIIYIDISHKKAYEKQLLEFKKILENNSEGVVITDISGDIRWINNAFSEITGYSLKEIIGNKTNILKSGIHDKEFYINMWSQLVNKGKWSGEIWNKNKKGEIYSEWLTINTIKDDSTNKVSYVGIFKDLSEKKRIDRRMNDLQQKDVLTGLYNRNYFLEIVDTFSCNCSLKDESFSIIFIDVQGLKEINDSLGHLLGDKLLIEISRRLITLVEDKYLLARFSGHEFALLYKTIAGRSDTYFFAKQLLERIKVPFTIDSTILHINVNIGISRFPEDAVDTETLIRYADIAMSRAKERSENKICFYNKNMSKEIDEKFLLANYLRSAISNDELNIYYQPIFDIKNPENIVGAEALIRWENPILGTVPPDRFIPLAEKTGQISAVGEWVLNQVCKQIHLWQCMGCHMVPIAVNISVKQLEKKGFHQIVADIIKENHIKPACIELEITESVSSGELATIVQNLKRLKGTGIKISMDDFGTGFSSLGQLDIFELDKLKIDKIFIDDIISLSKKQKLVKSIIAMAKGLDLAVVAEGIETSEQLLYLRKLGCQMGQGFLISRPLLVEEMEYLLNSRKH